MKDINELIAYSRGIWFCLTHSTFLNAYGYRLTKKDVKLRRRVYKWIDNGLTSNLSPGGLVVYNNWISQVRAGKIHYFYEDIPGSIQDMYAEIWEADIWIPSNLISLDNDFHKMFIDCYRNSDYFKKDPSGVYIEGIFYRDNPPYIKELIGNLHLLRKGIN